VGSNFPFNMFNTCMSAHILKAPLKNTIHAVEDQTLTLSCKYSSSNVYLYWYRQYPSSKLDFLLYTDESGRVSGSPPPGFTAKVQNKIMNLEISSAKLSDSAPYYCASRPTVTRSPATLYKN
uniref:Ig-like domain-containing protein n=1 Tax=Pygocentrus nattereri TaxID=42514 RepID=A0AAR2LSY2_PYGNA